VSDIFQMYTIDLMNKQFEILYAIPNGILIVWFVFYNHVIPSGLRKANPEGMELL